ncbi:metallophosphoesterase [Bacillus dakarensis]|uniref:metallophosphoesterase n=1 Tax=Robertmurraya dakarensis TaxID=1926278 RepID=UPI0009816625|nr:metallophosphoesterase [Bacillus dakarensis]
MPEKVSRRHFIKKALGTFLTVTGLSAGGYYYAGHIEPYRLKINHIQIKHPKVPNGFERFKMVQFSDTHLGFQYDLEQFKQIVDKINDLNPDILFFTGDLLDEPNKYKEIEKVVPILNQLQAPFGKFSIYGNHDHGGYGSDIYKEIMEKAGFTLLLNQSTEIKLLNGDRIYIAGIDDAMLGKPNIENSLTGVPDEAYKILLSHAPDLADIAASYNIHLQLSGHSHGGQIKIPFLGALVKPPFAEKYYEGSYTIGTDDPLTLYVNRGLGTTRLPFRFLSTPELTIYTLSSKN